MKTLKVALLVTTAAGAVAAGGVTYATVGNSSPAPSAQAAKHLPVADNAAPAVKAPNLPAKPEVPTCLPNLPKNSKALADAKSKVKQQIDALAAKAPDTPVSLPQVPAGKLPTDKLPTGKLPTGDMTKGKLPKVLPAKELAKLPVDKLPTCDAAAEPQKAEAAPPQAPGAPSLPDAVSCDKVPAVIKNEEAKAKEFNLPNGMKLGVSHAHRIVVQSRAACVYTQELVGAAPGMISVDRIKTPPQVTLAELAQGLKMPGQFVSVNGENTWQTPTHDGMLWYSDKGYAVRVVSSNPALAALVPGIASQLQTQ